jgi:hypothetical protein
MRATLIAVALIASGCAQRQAYLRRQERQKVPLYVEAAGAIDCPVEDVRLTRKAAVYRVTGCGQDQSFTVMCRKPGPREVAYVTSMPAPPSMSGYQQAFVLNGLTGGGTFDTALLMGSVHMTRRDQYAYGNQLAAARVADLEAGAASGELVAESTVGMPAHWRQAHCRLTAH